MSNRFFEDEIEAVHPTARAWLERIRQGQKATFTLWRKRDGLTFKPAKIYVAFETPSGKEQEHDDWDVDINEALVREGVPAESPENEAQRLSLMLRYWFSKPEERFGPGFFEAVLVDVLRGPEFSAKAPITNRLQRVHTTPPSTEGYSYGECKEAIEGIIKKAARALTYDLKYPKDKGESIHADALGQYLDERFHITERQMLGWA